MGSVMYPGFCADKNCTGRDGIIYVLVNLSGRLILCQGIDGVSNFLLQTPISFSATLRQTSCSSRCGSVIFQYVSNKKIGHWHGFRAINGEKKGDIYWISQECLVRRKDTFKYTEQAYYTHSAVFTYLEVQPRPCKCPHTLRGRLFFSEHSPRRGRC